MQHRWKARITSNPDVLTPVRHTGAEEKMQRFVAQLDALSAETAKPKQPIRANPKRLGYAA